MTISTIGTTGRTYSTIAAWEAAAAATLTAPWEGECYNDSEFTSATTICTFSGITASSTNFIELRPATGQGFKDHASAASNPLRYDQSKGVGIACTGTSILTIEITVDFVTLRGLQIKCAADSGAVCVKQADTSLSNTRIIDCILESGTGTSAGAYQGVVRFKAGLLQNCVFIQRNGSNGVYLDYPGTVNIYNCTVVRSSDITAATNAFRKESGGTVTLKNCAGFGFTNFSTGTYTAGDNSASDKTISFGSNNQASLTYSSQFEVVTDATRDFRAKSGGSLIDLGTNTGTPTTDIIGQAIANTTRDIGAWELQGGGGGGATFANPFSLLGVGRAA